jgi:flagellar biogenesis protein FliO
VTRALAMVVLSLVAPATARADAIAGLGFALEPDGIDVALRGSAPLQHPRIATSPGLVRLWFAGNDEYVHLDQRGDGVAVRKIRIRPGADATHLVQILLGDERRLDPAAVRVAVTGNMAHVRIARADLPALPAAPAALQEPVAPPAASPETSRPETADAQPAAVNREPPPQLAPASSTVSAASAAEPSPAAPPTRSRRRAARLPARRGLGLALYALLTLGLAVAYLVLRRVRRRDVGKGRPQIEVVAARRLGPRHQLVVVRAFGRDHLLSVNGGTTQRIASVRSSEPSERARPAPVPKATGGLFSKPWMDRSLANEAEDDLDGREPESPPRPRRLGADRDDPAFGAELLQLASATRQRTGAPSRSDSVSGLLRLRQQAGK